MESLIKNIINKFIWRNVRTIDIVSRETQVANLKSNVKFKKFQKKIKDRDDGGFESAAEDLHHVTLLGTVSYLVNGRDEILQK